MKKQLIAIGLVSFLAVPSVVLADACAPIVSEGMTEEALMAAKADMMGSSECMDQRIGSIEATSHGHGVSLYGSFRAGITFGSGDSKVSDYASRWGIKGSSEVSEGLTAAFKYETKITVNNAESGGGAGHSHAEVVATETGDPPVEIHGHAKTDDDGGTGGRLSYVSLSGGFGSLTVGQIWSASGVHYGFAVDPSLWFGSFGGSHLRNGNSISYASSAGDVSFQIDKVTGDAEKLEFGASADLGPIGVGLGYYSNANDDESFTGVAFSAGAAGVDLTIGLGGKDGKDATTDDEDISILRIGGSLGDSGISYAVQVTNSNADDNAGDQNLVNLTNSLGGGASIVFEHLDPGVGEASSLLALKVDF